jgi:hypothetical protein
MLMPSGAPQHSAFFKRRFFPVRTWKTEVSSMGTIPLKPRLDYHRKFDQNLTPNGVLKVKTIFRKC